MQFSACESLILVISRQLLFWKVDTTVNPFLPRPVFVQLDDFFLNQELELEVHWGVRFCVGFPAVA